MNNETAWVVAATVGDSKSATRTDASGDMEQLEMMELIEVSEYATRAAADAAAEAKRASADGWSYSVLSREDFDRAAGRSRPHAA